VNKSELVQEVVELQRQVGRIIGQHVPSVWIDSGLTITQLRSLFLIANKGRTNFRKLAEALGVTPSNVKALLTAWKNKDWSAEHRIQRTAVRQRCRQRTEEKLSYRT
jgi:DNA-binding MarR family transcriptional regulator